MDAIILGSIFIIDLQNTLDSRRVMIEIIGKDSLRIGSFMNIYVN